MKIKKGFVLRDVGGKLIAVATGEAGRAFHGMITLNPSARVLWDALLPQQRELVMKKLRGMSNTDIAASEGVTEAAVRNRLKKVQERFKIFK